ncbi:unnamed protein product, partial [Ectocarpus sp. 6 AP-2014]
SSCRRVRSFVRLVELIISGQYAEEWWNTLIFYSNPAARETSTLPSVQCFRALVFPPHLFVIWGLWHKKSTLFWGATINVEPRCAIPSMALPCPCGTEGIDLCYTGLHAHGAWTNASGEQLVLLRSALAPSTLPFERHHLLHIVPR